MNILFLLKNDPDPTIEKIIKAVGEESESMVINLKDEQDYAKLVDQIEACDRVISW